ncbi:MAG: hypothetical protein SV487_10090 [Thermodesulfobacteriota bacterium]|nr:hypothetical protein [Thermodesulfobacteriota bacterium]
MTHIFRQAPSQTGCGKHDCPDCRFCQLCSDSRCHACRSGQANPPRLSFAEQIDLYERRNHGDPLRPDQPITIG